MTAAELRQVIADALCYASVPGFAGSRLEEEFRDGGRDVQMTELEVDSLAAMELCIAIEMHSEVSLSPAEIEAMLSLDALVQRLVSGQ